MKLKSLNKLKKLKLKKKDEIVEVKKEEKLE